MSEEIDMSDKPTVRFRCSIPPIQSGIKKGGGVMRVMFDIPSSDVPNAVALMALEDTPLIVTVEVDDGSRDSEGTVKRWP